MNIAQIMLHKRVEQALWARRFAHHKLRIGDRFGHRTEMQEARFFLRLARQWKPKPEIKTTSYQEAAE